MVLLLRIVVEIRVHVVDMKLFLQGIFMDFPERTIILYQLLDVEMEMVHLELSVT